MKKLLFSRNLLLMSTQNTVSNLMGTLPLCLFKVCVDMRRKYWLILLPVMVSMVEDQSTNF